MEDFKFKKSFGQNFLNDKNIIKNIVDKTNIEDNSLVIEVGPGAGVLTKELAKVAKNVLSYEIDTRLEEMLDENLREYSNVSIIYDDFLNRNIVDDIKEYSFDNIYFVANIPYYITTPILDKLIESKIDFKVITMMVQKEVADRFSAHVKTKDYSSITVFLNYYFDIEKLIYVSRNAFTPKPNVDSEVIALRRKKVIRKANNEELFFKLVRDSFKFKRKNIRNNLKNYDLKVVEEVLSKYKKDLTSRAEELELDIFIDIANSLNK
jgi:16S rRNA (adenine1518-N6/adenine1519-N6)-dimethyltransferase